MDLGIWRRWFSAWACNLWLQGKEVECIDSMFYKQVQPASCLRYTAIGYEDYWLQAHCPFAHSRGFRWACRFSNGGFGFLRWSSREYLADNQLLLAQFIISHALSRFQLRNVLSAPLLALVVSKDGELCSGCHLPKFASAGSLSFLPLLCFLPVFFLSATSRLLPWNPLSMRLQCRLLSQHDIRANFKRYSDLISEEQRMLPTLAM